MWGKIAVYLYIITRAYVFPFFFLPRKDWKDNSKGGLDRGKEKFRFFFLLSHCFLISVTTLLFGSSTIPTFIHRTTYLFCTKKTALCLCQNFKQNNNLIFFFTKRRVKRTKRRVKRYFNLLSHKTWDWFVKSVKMAKLPYDHNYLVIKHVA